MTTVVVLLVLVGIALALATALGSKGSPRNAEHAGSAKSAPKIPFIRKPLLTGSELEFYRRLRLAFPDVQVCPQVALAALVDIPAKYNRGRYRHVNRAPFAAKFADFVIVDPATGDVHAILELDDHSHDGPERQAEDAARDAMLKEVGIPVHRFDSRKMPDVKALQDWFERD